MTTKKTIKVNAISKLILSVSAFVLCASLFMVSINTVTANDTKEFNFPDKLTSKDFAAVNGSNGRYQMELSAVTTEDGYTYCYLIMYDTTNAKAKFYYGSSRNGKFVEGFAVPSNPF